MTQKQRFNRYLNRGKLFYTRGLDHYIQNKDKYIPDHFDTPIITQEILLNLITESKILSPKQTITS